MLSAVVEQLVVVVAHMTSHVRHTSIGNLNCTLVERHSQGFVNAVSMILRNCFPTFAFTASFHSELNLVTSRQCFLFFFALTGLSC